MAHFMELDGQPYPTEEMRNREFERRRHAWFTAKEMADRLIDLHGLEPLRSAPVSVFTAPALVSKAQQHADLILDLADWLLGEED